MIDETRVQVHSEETTSAGKEECVNKSNKQNNTKRWNTAGAEKTENNKKYKMFMLSHFFIVSYLRENVKLKQSYTCFVM